MPFVSYIMQYFKNDFVLSTDKKFDVVRIVLPMVRINYFCLNLLW